MLEQVLTHLHNWFIVPGGKHFGTFTVEGGHIALPFLRDGQYFRIMGSVFSDGLHRYGPDMPALTDETFDGAVWALAIPSDVVDLAAEMAEWEAKNGAAAAGAYQSESFGGYSYSKATDSKTGGAVTVWSTFRERLNSYRRLMEV